MLATLQTAWLFTRGSESVRIVRAARPDGLVLIVRGPGGASETHEFTDVLACVKYQSDLEQRLVSQGYELERFTSDRRSSGLPSPAGRDRRRVTPLFL